MIRILIVDDHAIVRDGLKQIIEDHEDMVVAGEAGDGEEALSRIRREEFDVVLLDISMPGMGGLETLKRSKAEFPELPVLVLSMHPEEQYAIRVLKAGASGYLTKESASDELIAAIRKVAVGRKYVGSSLAERLAWAVESDARGKLHESLSDREYQVFTMIASGKRIKEIAAELSLSVKTISTYRTRILEKMEMTNNAELMRYAIENGLVD